MRLEEAPAQLGRRALAPHGIRHRHQQLVVLAFVAEVEPPGQLASLLGDALAVEPSGRLGLQLAEPPVEDRQGPGVERPHPGPHRVGAQVLDQQAQRAQDAGPGGTRMRGIPRSRARAPACSGPAPPNGNSASPVGSTPRWTVTTPERPGHVRVDHPDDAAGCVHRPRPAPRPAGWSGLHGVSEIEGHLAAQEPLGAEPAQDQLRVGDRRPPRRRARSRPAPGPRPRSGGPPCSAPPESRHAIARRRPRSCGCPGPGSGSGTSDLALEGEGRRAVPHEGTRRCWCRPCRTWLPTVRRAAWRASAAPATPALGPDSTVFTGARAASSIPMVPPFDWLM